MSLKKYSSYQKDMHRYNNEASLYIKALMFSYRGYFSSASRFIKLFYKIMFKLLSATRGLEIGLGNQIGEGLYLGHVYNITINPMATIGKNCNLHKGIVIGRTNRGPKKGYPQIGDEVYIGINAVVVGNIKIGNDVLIAPNAYVNCDVPPHSVVYGNPCVIKHNDHATLDYINYKV